jgi:hypothetical protein
MAVQAFLQTGRVTAQTWDLLRACVRDVVERFNFPPVYGHWRWDERAIEETVQEFCASPGRTIQQRLTHIALQSADHGDFEAQLRAAVANHIRSELRRTQRGRLAVVLREVLASAPEITRAANDTYALRDLPSGGVWAGRESDLIAAAWGVQDLKVIRWRPDAKHDPPVAERGDLQRICVAVLQTAQAAVDFATLVAVLAHRLSLRDSPRVIDIDDVAESLADPQASDVALPLQTRDDALWIWNQMTARERQVLPLLTESARTIAAALGISKSSAAGLINQCREVLRQALPSDRDEATGALQWLQRFAQALPLDDGS